MLKSFLKNLAVGIWKEGKTASGVLLSQLPLTSFPGITTALHTVATDHTLLSYVDLGTQVLMVVGATLKAGKIVTKAAGDSGSAF